MLKVVSLAACAVLASGCTGLAGVMGAHVNAYPGKERPVEEVAILLNAGSGTAYAMLNKLDGKRYGDEVFGYPSEIRVLPGEHQFVLHCMQGLYASARPEVQATLAAGHFYNLLCHARGDRAFGEVGDLGTEDPRKKQE